jgi:hypothetical protein
MTIVKAENAEKQAETPSTSEPPAPKPAEVPDQSFQIKQEVLTTMQAEEKQSDVETEPNDSCEENNEKKTRRKRKPGRKSSLDKDRSKKRKISEDKISGRASPAEDSIVLSKTQSEKILASKSKSSLDQKKKRTEEPKVPSRQNSLHEDQTKPARSKSPSKPPSKPQEQEKLARKDSTSSSTSSKKSKSKEKPSKSYSVIGQEKHREKADQEVTSEAPLKITIRKDSKDNPKKQDKSERSQNHPKTTATTRSNS